MINVIVPFSRPRMVENVLNNYRKQSYKKTRLIIVENNQGLGSFPRLEGVIILKSRAHVSHAKNTALDYIRKTGGGYCAIFDDDDFYGRDYLSEAIPHLGKAKIIGKHQHFIYQRDGLWLIQPEYSERPWHWCQGATQIFHSNEVGNFRVQKGEDVQFCLDERSVYLTSIYNFCYMRAHTDHLYQGKIIKNARANRWEVIHCGQAFSPAIVEGRHE